MIIKKTIKWLWKEASKYELSIKQNKNAQNESVISQK